MNPSIDELCKDALFQLNLAIWLTQPQAREHSYVYPLFYESGLNIYSIGPLLALPPDIRISIGDKLDCQDGARPDLILESIKASKKYCILECKASSFSSASSNAKQATTLLLLAGPIVFEVLGLGGRGQNLGLLCYLIGSSQMQLMDETFDILSREIRNLKLEPGAHGCFGLTSSQTGIFLEFSETVERHLSLGRPSPVEVIQLEEDSDPRPLYFIPYDPNCMDQQSKEEQEFCRRILFERILSHIISEIGGADMPASLVFTTEGFLNSATFGLYEIWEDNEAKKHLRRIVKDFLMNVASAFDEPLRKCMSYKTQVGWAFNISNKATQAELLKQLMKFKPETLDLSKRIQPSLFDDED